MPPIEAILLGAGNRGMENVGRFALNHPSELKFVAVAEPDTARKNAFAQKHAIPEEHCFVSYQELLEKLQLAPLCFNNTMDRQHLDSSIRALNRGYHLFLEKPIAETREGCLKIAAKALEMRRLVQICHPLRYAPFYRQMKRLLSEGAIGEISAVYMQENVEHGHFAHAFVRGNWGNVEKSGPLILTKCCHDMDLVAWLVGEKVRRVSSFGELKYFNAHHAPAGAPDRCLDGCPAREECLYDASAIYLTPEPNERSSAICVDQNLEVRRRALQTSPYGRCVFKCDNTAVDTQSVLIEFSNQIIASFSVAAHSSECFRTIRVLGNKGELNGHCEKSEISINRFDIGQKGKPPKDPQVIHVENVSGSHAGGDISVIRNFLRAYKEMNFDELNRSLEYAIEGHLLAFAAEDARVHNRIVNMDEFTGSS